MTTVALDSRRAYQERVASLLDELDQQRQRLYVLMAGGAKPAGMREQKSQLESTRRRLRETLERR